MSVRAVADWTGAISSAVCVVHCLAGPLALLVAPLLPSLLLPHAAFHAIMLYLIVPTGVVALTLGCWRHKDLWTLALGCFGLVGLLLVPTALHDSFGGSGERIGTVIASTALIAGHVRNFRLCRRHECQHEPDAV